MLSKVGCRITICNNSSAAGLHLLSSDGRALGQMCMYISFQYLWFIVGRFEMKCHSPYTWIDCEFGDLHVPMKGSVHTHFASNFQFRTRCLSLQAQNLSLPKASRYLNSEVCSFCGSTNHIHCLMWSACVQCSFGRWSVFRCGNTHRCWPGTSQLGLSQLWH